MRNALGQRRFWIPFIVTLSVIPHLPRFLSIRGGQQLDPENSSLAEDRPNMSSAFSERDS